MDINLFSTMLKELILENDSVTIPGIGTFNTESVSAGFSEKGLAINPPYRKLSFSSEPGSDTLLPDFYSSSNGIDSPRAGAIIDRFVSGLKNELTEMKSVDLPGLGRLRVTRDGELFFIPDDDLEICPDTFGLGSVSLRSHRVSDAALTSLPELTRPKAGGESPAKVEHEAAPPVPVPESSEVTREDEAPAVRLSRTPDDRPGQEDVKTPAECKKKSYGAVYRAVVSVVVAALVLVAAFVLLSRFSPDFIDRLLYTAEEREILNYPL